MTGKVADVGPSNAHPQQQTNKDCDIESLEDDESSSGSEGLAAAEE